MSSTVGRLHTWQVIHARQSAWLRKSLIVTALIASDDSCSPAAAPDYTAAVGGNAILAGLSEVSSATRRGCGFGFPARDRTSHAMNAGCAPQSLLVVQGSRSQHSQRSAGS
jgi:hypothetical protein